MRKEVDRLLIGERRHGVLDLAADPQPLPAGDKDAKIRATFHKGRQLGRSVDHMLEAVEQEQEIALADVRAEAVLRAQRLRDRLGHEGWIADGCNAHPEDAASELRHELGSGLDSETRLPRAARAAQRDEATAVL